MKKAGLLLFILMFSSCVNKDFDLSNGIVADATLFENVSLPIGDVDKITLEKLLFAEEGSDAGIEADADGDLYIDFAGGSTVAEINVAEFVLGTLDLADHNISFVIPDQLAGLPSDFIDMTIKYSDVVKGGLEFGMELSIDSPLPAGIKNVAEVYMDADLDCTFKVSGGKMYVSKGFEFVFPDFIKISAKNAASEYELIDGHIVRFVEDAVLSAASPLSLSLCFDSISISENNIVKTDTGERKIILSDSVDIKGDFYINTKDYSVVPSALDITIDVAFDDMKVTKALAEIELDAELPEEDIEISGIPELLKGKGVCIDLYNPVINLVIENGSPFDFAVDADITAYMSVTSYDVHIGSNGVDNDLRVYIPSSSTRDYRFSRRALDPTPGVNNVVIPEIADLIKEIPDRLSIHDFNISVENGLTMVETGKSYRTKVSYGLNSPLAFDKDLKLAVEQDVEMNLELEPKLPSVKVGMNIINSVPVDFDIKAVCLDVNGNTVTNTTVTIDKSISAGTVSEPVATPVTLSIENTNGRLQINALRLTMTATSGGKYQGVCLNKNQGLEIKDIVLTLPDGIGVEIK